MTIRIDAYVLLRRPWKLDIEAIASELEWRYPQIGKARLRRSSGGESHGTIVVEGAPVEVSHVGAPYPPEQLHPPMRTIGHDPAAVDLMASAHSAYLVVTANCPSDGLEWCLAHAALVTLVAGVAADKADGLAIIWPDSWVVLDRAHFEDAAATVLRGHAPLNLWCAFAHSNPPRVGGVEMTGIASLGLRKFLGRELELAPMPSMSGEAIGCMREAARLLTEGEWVPEDYGALELKCFSAPLTVRLCDEGFLRPGVPAVVLIAPEAAVDPATLARKGAAAPRAEGGGLMKRLFGRG